MLASLFGIIRNVIMLCIVAIVLYTVGYLFDWLPEDYAPHNLMPEEYKDLKSKLHRDAYSASDTADYSKKIYKFLDEKDDYYDNERKEEAKEKAEAEKAQEDNIFGNPMEKTKDLMEQMKERNRILEEEL